MATKISGERTADNGPEVSPDFSQWTVICFLFSFHSQSFAFPQPHWCSKPDLDVQSFTSTLGNQKALVTNAWPLPKQTTYTSWQKGWILASLESWFATGFHDHDKAWTSNKATPQSRQELLYHLTHTFWGPHTAPSFRPTASAQAWKSRKESRKGKPRRLQKAQNKKKQVRDSAESAFFT